MNRGTKNWIARTTGELAGQIEKEMTASDIPLSYGTFCGTTLDDMLEQIIHNVVTRSLLDEKLTRKDYGTVKKPIFHDPPGFQDQPMKKGCKEEKHTKNSGAKGANRGSNGNGSRKDPAGDDADDDDDGVNDDADEDDEDAEQDYDAGDNGFDSGTSTGSPRKNGNHPDRNGGGHTRKRKQTVQHGEPDIGRFAFTLNGKDIYVNALNANRNLLGVKANAIVLGTAQDTYFKCSNCERKIAGSRFGAHIDKCYGGRSRK